MDRARHDAEATALEMLGVREGSRFLYTVDDHHEAWSHAVTSSA